MNRLLYTMAHSVLLRLLFVATAFIGLAGIQPLESQPLIELHRSENPCYDEDFEVEHDVSDLYCLPLEPIPDLKGASGYAVLRPAMSPFGVDVDRFGRHRYRVELHIEGLPAPESLGPYTAYVAWATTPLHHPTQKLGLVQNGVTRGEEVAFNKFLVLISAEPTGSVVERSGRLVLRGMSPSTQMEGHDLLQVAPLALAGGGMGRGGHAMGGMHEDSSESVWPMPPMHPSIPMLPGMMTIRPSVAPYVLPDSLRGARPAAFFREEVSLNDGDTFRLTTEIVQRDIGGHALTMYGFNRQHPGPLLHVRQHAQISIDFLNEVNLPSAIHWHGLRLDYRHDGVPGLTQDLVQPGQSHPYVLRFPDAGIYWYHPHFREDIKMDLGLYANIIVRPDDPGYYNQVHREELIVLDDLLLDDEGIVPYGTESSNFMMMGRFGNTFLINGTDEYQYRVDQGEVIRFFLTNASNTRTYNLTFGDIPLKLIGSDVGKFEREVWTDNVVIATAERYIIEVQFDEPGLVPILNQVQAIDHRRGIFFPEIDTLGFIHIRDEPVPLDLSEPHARLRANQDVIDDMDVIRQAFDKPIDRELAIKLEVENLPPVVQQLMRFDNVYFNPVEWSGTMRMMNWASTGEEVQWILEDPRTEKRNMEIDWEFNVGDLVKIKLTNEREAFHAMQHPIHIHGQRFAVAKRNGIPNDNLVWKDTMILPAGSTAEILLEVSNPGKWMVHCHIAEHIDSGMMFVFDAVE